MKKYICEMLLGVGIMCISLILYLMSEDHVSGWNSQYNLHDGYIIEFSSAEQSHLIHWTKEREEKEIEGAVEILEGNFSKFYNDSKCIVIYDMRKSNYYCINKKTERIQYKCKRKKRMGNFIKSKYQIKELEMEDIQ